MVAVLSCEKDDEKEVISLVGTWKVTSDERKGCDDPAFNYFSDYSSCTPTNCFEITFTSGGKTIEKDGNGSLIDEGTYSITDNEVFLCLHFNYVCGDFTFKIVESTLTLSNDDFNCMIVVVLEK
jgi:hypothetical protein